MKTEQIKLLVTANIQYTDGNHEKAIELAKYCIKSRSQWTESHGVEVKRIEVMEKEKKITKEQLKKYRMHDNFTFGRDLYVFTIDQFNDVLKSLKK